MTFRNEWGREEVDDTICPCILAPSFRWNLTCQDVRFGPHEVADLYILVAAYAISEVNTHLQWWWLSGYRFLASVFIFKFPASQRAGRSLRGSLGTFGSANPVLPRPLGSAASKDRGGTEDSRSPRTPFS